MRELLQVLFLCALASGLILRGAAGVGSPYVSNVDNRWRGQAPQEIGDIHSVTAYGPTTVAFSTGNEGTILTAVTFEFIVYPEFVGSWNSVDLALRSSGSSTTIAQLGSPQLSSTRTQWPKEQYPQSYTQFVEFQPAAATYLPPLTDFEIVVSRRRGSPLDSGLLFTKSADYKSMDGWQMGPTTSANPVAAGEFLKFAVHAIVVPEPTLVALADLCALLILWRRAENR